MKLCLITRGNCENPKLWSGTPSTMLTQMRKIPDLTVEWANCEVPRIIRTPVYHLLKNNEFFMLRAGEPWNRWFYLNKLRRATQAAEKNQTDFLLMISDFLMPPKRSAKVKYAIYIDNLLSAYFPYLSGDAWWRKWYEDINHRNDLASLSSCDLIFTQNEWTRQAIRKLGVLKDENIHNVGFGVNLQPYTGEKNYDNEELLIVLRRGTERYKGLYLLLDAFELLRKQRPGVKLSVVGTTGRTIDGVTYFEGYPREKTVELFQRASLYVMPALREPNGITYLEGLANRAPIVGLERFALPEFSGYCKWGFMAKHEDPAELATVLNDALSDKERLRQMGIAGQQFVAERFQWDKVCRNMYQKMREFCSESR